MARLIHWMQLSSINDIVAARPNGIIKTRHSFLRQGTWGDTLNAEPSQDRNFFRTNHRTDSAPHRVLFAVGLDRGERREGRYASCYFYSVVAPFVVRRGFFSRGGSSNRHFGGVRAAVASHLR